MSNCLLNQRSPSLIIFVKRSIVIRSDFDLRNQMKWLHDNKQSNKSLELFDKHKKTSLELFSSLIITQVLKVSAHTEDLQRGTASYHLISSCIQNNSNILVS